MLSKPRRVALVTGAGSGIGRAVVTELARRGYGVAAADQDLESAQRTASDIRDGLALQVDVSDLAQVERAVEQATKWAGQIDVLVNNAGIGSTQTVVDTSPEVWDRVFAVNVRGTFNCCRTVLPFMIARRSGAIINVASVVGLVALPERAAYAASKGAIISLTRAMAVDHVRDGIRVNCVCPGTIDTPWVASLIESSDDPAATKAALVERQPMGRLGTAEEVAAAIAYLASDEAAFVSGAALVIDGGLSAGRSKVSEHVDRQGRASDITHGSG